MASVSQGDFGVVLVLFVVAAVFHLWRLRRLHAERLKTDRYALFAVRDHLIRLVAEGHIEEEDELFQFMYKEVNDIIPKAKPLTLRNFVRALRESRLIHDKAFAEKCLDLLHHSNEPVRQVTHEFFQALADILLTRSKFVRVSVHVTRSGIRAFSFCRKGLSLIFKTESEAYSQHKALQDLCSA
jgi:hypothetical protein